MRRIAVLGPLLALTLLTGCGTTVAAQTGDGTVAAVGAGHTTAGSPWSPAWGSFPVAASPRPLVLVDGEVNVPSTGFRTGADKMAFIAGRFTRPPHLPPAASSADGYPIVDASHALDRLRAAGEPGMTGPHRLVITGLVLGTARFSTDRGMQSLPAWIVHLRGVHDPAAVLAVASSRIFTAEPVGEVTSTVTAATERPNGRTLNVEFFGAAAGTGPCTAGYSLRTSSTRTTVSLTVLEHRHANDGNDACAAMAYSRRPTITLGSALGSRVLLDQHSSSPVPVTVDTRSARAQSRCHPRPVPDRAQHSTAQPGTAQPGTAQPPGLCAADGGGPGGLDPADQSPTVSR